MKKGLILFISNIICILITIFILCVFCGVWFDTENLLKHDDYEIYHPPLWQYFVYYLSLILLSIINLILVVRYKKQGRIHRNISYFFYGVIIFYCIVFSFLPVV